jgi:hypothetical protein
MTGCWHTDSEDISSLGRFISSSDNVGVLVLTFYIIREGR